MDGLLLYVILICIAYSFVFSAIFQGVVVLTFFLVSKKVLKYVRGWMITWGISSLLVSLLFFYDYHHPINLNLSRSALIYCGFAALFLISCFVGCLQFLKMRKAEQ